MRVVLLEDEPIWAAEVGDTVRRNGWRLRWFDTIARFEAGFDLSGEIDRTRFGSTGGVPDVAAELPIRIRLLMSSR